MNHSVWCNTVCTVFLGKKKSNLGWTPLHLACYFGHRDVVEELLKVLFSFFKKAIEVFQDVSFQF